MKRNTSIELNVLFYPVLAIYVIYVFLLILIPYLIRGERRKKVVFFSVAFLPMIILILLPGPIELTISGKPYLTDKYDWIVKLTFVWTSIWLLFDVINMYRKQSLELHLSQNEKQRIQLDKEREVNEIIQSKNEELEETVYKRTLELTTSLNNLKATQEKLIHSEKLAHLGQLTAGVAHEIQNPLNFINNFSELNSELSDELSYEVKAGKQEEILGLAECIKSNSQKVFYHGKRAESIIKSMLQHSKPHNEKVTLADINALLDESWRLAYHGFRYKEKAFNVHVNFDFDIALEKININAEEIGRVFINLISNALYAIHQRWRTNPDDPDYLPSIDLITLEINNGVLIKIIDRGTGIPDSIKKEIFNPFFTTKPAGQGVGLGLSLVYDIVTKGHNGKIDFESKEGEGTTFIIEIPRK